MRNQNLGVDGFDSPESPPPPSQDPSPSRDFVVTPLLEGQKLIVGGTKRIRERNRSVTWTVASKHILEREDRFCRSSCTNDWATLVIAQGP